MLPGRTSDKSPVSIRLAVTVAVLGFVALGCLWIERPGLQYDETLFVTASYPNLQRGGAGYIEVFGQPVCTMVLPYLGALKGWLYRLILAFAPPSAGTVRVPVVLLGAFTLLLLFSFARRAFDGWTGLIAVVLAASDPTFLFTTRLDWGPVVIQRLCWLGGCLLLLRWREHPSAGRLFAAFAVFGIGLFDKLSFVWILAALFVATLIVFRTELAGSVRRRAAAVAVPGFLLGCLPLLVYRFSAPKPPLNLRWESSLTPYRAKLSMLYHCLDGTIFQGWLAHVTAPKPTLPTDGLARWVCRWTGETLIDATWFPWALAAAVVLLPWTLRTPLRRGLLFVFLFSLTAIVVMLPVESGGSAHHLALIYPFPQLFVAASLTAIGVRLVQSSRPRLGPALLLVVTCVLVFTNVRAVAQQYGQILQFGGTPPWSEAIYDLHTVVETENPNRILVLDWGIAMQLRLLSRDRLPLKEAPQPLTGERYFVEAVRQSLAEPGTVLVGYDPSVASVNPRTRELLDQAVRDAGRGLRRRQLIWDRQGRPLFEVLETK
jgi:4-amino-4-deoxy-L-arabinose transferase-like glycosyltransferase